ncbi:MAG: TonB-dependent receptor, partial [Candidatus Krumholzibacteriota bacterium]|nr:TonB-dependent receptor [Candidatus Krumholzibacteriota bacterium]
LTDADFDANPIRRYAASKNDVMDNQHRMASIRHFIMPSEGVDVTTTIYNNGFDRNWYKLDNVGGVRIDQILEDPGTYASEYAWITGDSASANDALAVKANNREYFSQGVESIVGWNVHIAGAENDMEFGLRLHRDEEDRFQWTDGYRMEEGGAMVRTSEGVPGAAGGGDNRVNSARAVAAFWQDNIVMNALILVPGLRFEHIETKREQYASGDPGRTQSPLVTEQTLNVVLPGIGAHYRVTPSVGLIAGIHKGFSPPGPGASAATLPEESVNYEAGVRYGSGTVSASALGFFNDYENLLGKDTFSGGGDGSGDLFNAGEVTAYGVETELRWQPAAGRYRFPVSATYTYSYAAFQNSFTSGFHPWGEVEAGDRVPYIPAHQFNMTLAMSNERFDVGLMGNYQSRMRTEAGQGEIPISESTDARFVFDATGELDLGGGLRAFAAVQNIGDQTYIVARRPAGVRPGLPRTISLGLKLDL